MHIFGLRRDDETAALMGGIAQHLNAWVVARPLSFVGAIKNCRGVRAVPPEFRRAGDETIADLVPARSPILMMPSYPADWLMQSSSCCFGAGYDTRSNGRAIER